MSEPLAEPQVITETRRGCLPWPLERFLGLLPLAPLEFTANRILLGVLQRHPGLVARMGEHAAKRFAIDPSDCPFTLFLELSSTHSKLRAVPSLVGQPYDARIAGPMVVLIGLLDGTYDGDALFFSRDLVIEGDTAAVLALRNAIEDADLDPARIIGVPEAMAPYFDTGLREISGRLRSWLGAPKGAVTEGDV